MSDKKQELVSRFAELMPKVLGRMRLLSLAWPYEALTQTQIRTLMLLEEAPAPMSSIASSLTVVLPSATRIIDALVRKGLIARSEDDKDRRRVLCSLTEDGRTVLNRIAANERKRSERTAQLLESDELIEIVHSLELLQAALIRAGRTKTMPENLLSSPKEAEPSSTERQSGTLSRV